MLRNRFPLTLYLFFSLLGFSLVAVVSAVIAQAQSAVTGLDFPGSAGVATTMRFKFANPQNNGLPIYGPGGNGVTYIWRAYPRQQAGYYTAFFWANDDGQGNINTFIWVGGGVADTYYGAHPYPRLPDVNRHDWEISIEQSDYVNGAVVYDRWYTQALRVWSDATGKHHEFYWDLPNTDASHRVTHDSPPSWGNANPPAPALTWGDAPWNPGHEVWNGILRGFQIYSALLSLADIQSEATAPLSTSAGRSNIWYLNSNPTPTDISDKSGRGHNPVWVGSERPALYTASTPTPSSPTNLGVSSNSDFTGLNSRPRIQVCCDLEQGIRVRESLVLATQNGGALARAPFPVPAVQCRSSSLTRLNLCMEKLVAPLDGRNGPALSTFIDSGGALGRLPVRTF